MSYAKIFSSIVMSSIWSESSDTRVVWITMLVLKDREGVVLASVDGLANLCRLPIEVVQKAIDILSSPDPKSKDPQFGGRRIEALPQGGWRILNAEKYRRMMMPDDRREYHRKYMRYYMRGRREMERGGRPKSNRGRPLKQVFEEEMEFAPAPQAPPDPELPPFYQDLDSPQPQGQP